MQLRIVTFLHNLANALTPRTRSILLQGLLLLCLLTLISACSSSTGNTERNTISPYDDVFDPDSDDSANDKNKVLSSEEQQALLQEALKFYDKGLYTAARDALGDLQRQFPSSYYAALIELKLADANYFLGEYQIAIELYEEFIRLRPNHEASPYAQLQIGNSYYAQYRGVMFDQGPLNQAETQFNRVVQQYPKSGAAYQAEQMLTRCNALRLAHERYVAGFYRGQGLDEASLNRLARMLENTDASQREALLTDFEETLSEEQMQQLRTHSQETPPQRQTVSTPRSTSANALNKLRSRSHLPSSQHSNEPFSASTQQVASKARQVEYFCLNTSNAVLLELVLPLNMQSQKPRPYKKDKAWFIDLPEAQTDTKYELARTSNTARKRCEDLGIEVSLTRRSSGNAALRIQPGADDSDPRFLALDRPSRFIALFNRATQSNRATQKQ